MKVARAFSRRIPKIGLSAGWLPCLLILIGTIPLLFAEDAGGNFLALHDKSSSQYERDCLPCHADVLTQQSLDTGFSTAHVTMLPLVPGEENRERCAWCHRGVDLVEKSTGNLRKHVRADLCALCHGPSGPGARFYQAGPSPAQPDGPALYELACSPCHGDLANSEVRGESASEIRQAIAENEGGMGPLAVLLTAEIQAIAEALAGSTGSGGGD